MILLIYSCQACINQKFYKAVYGDVADLISGLGASSLWFVYAAHTLTLKSCQRTLSEYWITDLPGPVL